MAGLSLLVATSTTCGLVAWLPVPAWAQAATVVAIGMYALQCARRWVTLSSPRAITEIVVRSDRQIRCTERSGRCIEGAIADDSYVGTLLTTIVFHAAGCRRARTLALLPDMLSRDDFRRLRVLLRLARLPSGRDQASAHPGG
jgi:hypothetical protein